MNVRMSTSQNNDADGLREPYAFHDVLSARRLEPQGTVHEGRTRRCAEVWGHSQKCKLLNRVIIK